MNVIQVKKAFINKKNTPCPITDFLVKNGFHQKSGGYLKVAKEEGITVDFSKGKPSQYWHLMSYLNAKDDSVTFGRNIVCGELIFWMAEVSGVFEDSELKILAERIIENREGYKRRNWNRVIQEFCFERIKAEIEGLFL